MVFRLRRSFCRTSLVAAMLCTLPILSAHAAGRPHPSSSKASRTPKTDLGLFSIRAPQGYRYQSRVVEQQKLYIWAAPQSQPGPLQGLVISVAPAPPMNLTAHSSVDFLAGVLDSMHSGWKNWHQSRFQTGRIHGQPFVQAQWSGINPNGVGVQGFACGAILTAASGHYTCLLTGMDLTGSKLPVLQQTYLAAQTFQAKPGN